MDDYRGTRRGPGGQTGVGMDGPGNPLCQDVLLKLQVFPQPFTRAAGEETVWRAVRAKVSLCDLLYYTRDKVL